MEETETKTTLKQQFEAYVGHLCDLSYHDGSGRATYIKGNVLAVSEEFLTIRTFKREYLINLKNILSIRKEERP